MRVDHDSLHSILSLKNLFLSNPPKEISVLIGGTYYSQLEYIIRAYVDKYNMWLKIYLDKYYVKILFKDTYSNYDILYLNNHILCRNFHLGNKDKIIIYDDLKIGDLSHIYVLDN